MELDLQYLDKIIDDKSKVLGEIYCITNALNNKKYIGQTLTHRLNHGRYRPFGYLSRFRNHVSQAMCHGEAKKCYDLHVDIRANSEAFSVDLLTRCKIDQLDNLEEHFILMHNSLAPKGYNLTSGGVKKIAVSLQNPNRIVPEIEHVKRERNDPHPEETKDKIGKGIRKYHEEHPDEKRKISERTKNQHYEKKFQIFDGIEFDYDNLDQYIRNRTNKGVPFVCVLIDKKEVNFYDKTGNVEDCKKRAKEFLKELVDRKKKLQLLR